MRTRSPLAVDVFELLESPGSRKHLAFGAPVEQLEVGLTHVEGDVSFDLMLEAIEGGIWVRGTISGRYAAECRRCLAPVSDRFEVTGAELYRPQGEAWEEGYVIRETTLDLGPFVRDAVLLDLPPNPLCRPGCAGLCPRCGANLNEGPCACPPETDPRWSALKDLGKQLG